MAVYEEAMKMSEEAWAIAIDVGEETGYMAKRDIKRDIENAKKIAKKMLIRGDSIEEVVEITEIPLETVTTMANQLEGMLTT
jgi:transposase